MGSIENFLTDCAWLYTKIYQNQIFFLDLWTLVHMYTSFVIYLYLRAFRLQRPMTILVIILLMWEITEILFVYFAFWVFKPEIIKDQFTDIFLGVLGGIACYYFLLMIEKYHKRYQLVLLVIVMFIVSTSYAFFWVGFYGYKYNVEWYNTPGINFSSWLGWTAGGMGILIIFHLLRKLILPYRFALTWLIFFLCLLVFEYTYYYLLDVREISGYPLKPLIFGLIHGTRTLHVFYISAPLITISHYYYGIWLIKHATKRALLPY